MFLLSILFSVIIITCKVAMGSMRSLKCPVGSLGLGDLGVSESQGD